MHVCMYINTCRCACVYIYTDCIDAYHICVITCWMRVYIHINIVNTYILHYYTQYMHKINAYLHV